MIQTAAQDFGPVHNGKIQVSKVIDDLRLVTYDMPEARSVALGVFVGVGSRDEDGRLSGASHLLEHLVFKGTAEMTARQIAISMDLMGGESNGFTSRESTYFYVRVLPEDLAEAAGILFGMLSMPILRQSDLDSERQVVLDEIAMNMDSPHDVCAQRCQEALFPGHPLGNEVSGTAGSVEAIDAEMLRDWFDSYYRCSNIIIAAAGALDHEQLAPLVERWFGHREGGKSPQRTPPSKDQIPLVVTRRDTEQASMEITFRGFSRHDKDRWSAEVLDQIVGGSMSSRLFQEIREQRGLAYSVWSDANRYDDTGSFSISAGCAPSNLMEVLNLSGAILADVATNGVTDEEINLAKKHLRSGLLLSQEHSVSRMAAIGSSLLHYGRVIEIDEILSNVDAVSADDVARVASVLSSSPMTLSVVGPFDEDALSGWSGGDLYGALS